MAAARLPRRFAPLTLGLAFWYALPALDWCPLSWDECRAACEEAPAGATACALPCDPEPDPIPAGDRAWCIRALADGLPARAPALSSPDAHIGFAAIAERAPLEPPRRARLDFARAKARPPTLASPHAPPQSRAPPRWSPRHLV
jgi:hypothetical protein